jgi:signal transduction histidine kinase
VGGVGLGLAVARRIAAAFGGTLDAQSRPGQGTRLTLCLSESAANSLPPAAVG